MSAFLILLICPVLILASVISLPQIRLLTRTVALLMWAQMAVAVAVCARSLGANGPASAAVSGFRLDGTAALFLLLTTLVTAAALTHTVGFFAREAESAHPPTLRDIRQFYLFAALFVISMYAVVAADNLGFLWISIEATTLLSAPLVYFHRSRTALEATWKYLIICSVGIAFAFFGTAILYAASQQVPALAEGTLSVTTLTAQAKALPPGLLRLGFVFILLGYGTKAGLFPLHSWLPDAHSEAPAPASALLSGALLNCALVALWRVSGLMTAAGDAAFVRITLLPMGALTVLAAGLFLLKQQDLKRMLAYSSMENMGLMAVAIALGSASGFGLLALSHSLVKASLFLLAGNLLQEYGTKKIREIRGILQTRPATAALLLLGVIAVAGTPPFGSFLAEWQILSAAAGARQWIVALLLLLALAVAFIAILVQTTGMAFGEKPKREPEDTAPAAVPLSLLVPGLLMLAALLLGFLLTPEALALAQGAAP